MKRIRHPALIESSWTDDKDALRRYRKARKVRNKLSTRSRKANRP